jgi:hypothetical protein
MKKEVRREGRVKSFWNTKGTITRPLTIEVMLYNIFHPSAKPSQY